MNTFRLGCVLAATLSACRPQPEPGPAQGPDPCAEPGTVCTWMGSAGLARLSPEGVGRLEAGLYFPEDILFSPDGSAFVPDFNNHRVSRVDPKGIVTTVVGTGVPGDGVPEGPGCEQGCEAQRTELWHPAQMALDPERPSVLVIAAWHNHRIMELDLDKSELTWVIGTGEPGYGQDTLSYPSSVALGPDGAWYISDQGNQMVRRLLGGELQDVAGAPGLSGYEGDGGPALDARLHGHADWAGGPTSKLEVVGREILLADTLNGIIRAIDLDTGTIERRVGRFVPGAEAGSLPGYAGDGGPALEATFAFPRDVAMGPDGALYVADAGNHCIRRVDPDGTVEAFAGRCGQEGMEGDEGPALEATFDLPSGLAFDRDGHLYVADSNNHVIRRITR
jgi:hypothetical protein